MSILYDFASAIFHGDSPTVLSLIANGSVDANARLPRHDSPPALVYAVSQQQLEVVAILLRANARVDDAAESGMTACHAAAATRCHKVLPLLLAHKPNLELLAHSSDLVPKVEAKYKAKHTALQQALSMPDNERVSLILIEAGASLERVAPGDLCRFAATSTAAIQALLERGVVVRELRDDYGRTALHCAAADTATRKRERISFHTCAS